VALQDAASPQSNILGAATRFDILAGSTTTNVGISEVNGDVGVSPGAAIVGYPPGVISNGAQHGGDATAAAAQVALTTAFSYVMSRPGAVDLSGLDLGGMTLLPGVYKFTSSAGLTGTLTLDAAGDPNAQWFFQIGSTLTTAVGANVALINSARARNVYFAVGTSATLGTTTTFSGNILAQASITMTTNASIQGRALARVGAVTTDTVVGTNALDVIAGTTAAMSNGVYDVVITFADLTTTTCLGAFTVHA
jgi:Ice-binding-like